MGTGLLHGEDMAAFRGERLVLRGIGLSVAGGGALLLTGPNGAGKSTLVRVLAGLVPLAAGSLRWDGKEAASDRAGHGARVAYLGHLDAIKPGLTAAENLRLWADAGAVARALDDAGLGMLADLPARMLSAGQTRRLALARLALRRAPLWLLDEPTLGLDAAAVARFGVALAAHRAGGGVVIAATHLPLPLPDAATLALGG